MPNDSDPVTIQGAKTQRISLTPTQFADVEQSGKPERILIAVHGIRDDGAWAQNVQIAMNNAGYDHQVCRADYKRFGPLPFVLGLGMKNRAEEVRQKIQTIIKDHPNAIVDIYCHSNGTKMFVAAAKELEGLSIRNLILAGSVCRDDELDELLRKDGFTVDSVWNECGLKDRWPVFADSLRPDLFQQTGVRGFSQNQVKNRFYPLGAHGTAINPDHFKKHILPILIGQIDNSTTVPYVQFPKWVQPTYVRILIATIVGALTMAFWALPFWGALFVAALIGLVYHQWMEW